MPFDRQFPLFRSHIDYAHQVWKQHLSQGDWAIDATCGNGKDTLFLAELLAPLSGGLIALDIQESAIMNTKALLEKQLSPAHQATVHLYHQSHETFPEIAHDKQIKIIIYNLGYLPRGNKSLTTLTSTTLVSVKNALSLLISQGLLSITCYPGHLEGAREEEALLEWSRHLDPKLYSVCHLRWQNRKESPSLLMIQKA